MNHDINKASRQFVAFINNEPVAFDSYLHMPHPIAKNIKRQHRLVVKPDYQGIGIGSRLNDFVANLIVSEGFRVTSTTSAPSLIFSRKHNERWKLKTKGRKTMKVSKKGIKGLEKTQSGSRMTTAWEFV